MEFRTKREAEAEVRMLEHDAQWCEWAAARLAKGSAMQQQREGEAKRCRSEAARIRALLLGLEE